MEKFTTRKGAIGIVVDNYKFRKSKDCKSTIAWRCCITTCKSTCVSDKDVTKLTKEPSYHNHPSDERVIFKDRIRESCKRRAVEEITERAVQIVCTEANRVPGLDQKDFKRLKDSIYRARQKQRPNQHKPKTDVFKAQGEPSSLLDDSNPDLAPNVELGQDMDSLSHAHGGMLERKRKREHRAKSSHDSEPLIFTTDEGVEDVSDLSLHLLSSEDMKDEEDLITAVKAHPYLYDRTNLKYRNKECNQLAWSDIAAELNIDVNFARKKWKGLHDYFITQVRRERKGLNDQKKWPLFECMTFLLTCMQSHNFPETDSSSCLDPSTNNIVSYNEEIASVASSIVSTTSTNSTAAMKRDKIPFCPDPTTFLLTNNSLVKSIKLETIEREESPPDPYAEELEALGKYKGHDSDYLFLMSLIPSLKILRPMDKLEFKHNVHGLLLTYLEKSRSQLGFCQI